MPKINPITIWLTGLPSSGKTTLANNLHQLFSESNVSSVVIDGDIFRSAFCNDLGFSLNDRHENVRRAARLARLVNSSGVLSVAAFVSPTIAIRQEAREIIGQDSFIEVFVHAPMSICSQRDIKGLYNLAKVGEIKDFTGVSSPFEPPQSQFCTIDTSFDSPSESTKLLFNSIKQKVFV